MYKKSFKVTNGFLLLVFLLLVTLSGLFGQIFNSHLKIKNDMNLNNSTDTIGLDSSSYVFINKIALEDLDTSTALNQPQKLDTVSILHFNQMKITVKDEKLNEELENVLVRVNDIPYLTDIYGECQVSLNLDRNFVVITKAGYGTYSDYVGLNENNNLEVSLQLTNYSAPIIPWVRIKEYPEINLIETPLTLDSSKPFDNTYEIPSWIEFDYFEIYMEKIFIYREYSDGRKLINSNYWTGGDIVIKIYQGSQIKIQPLLLKFVNTNYLQISQILNNHSTNIINDPEAKDNLDIRLVFDLTKMIQIGYLNSNSFVVVHDDLLGTSKFAFGLSKENEESEQDWSSVYDSFRLLMNNSIELSQVQILNSVLYTTPLKKPIESVPISCQGEKFEVPFDLLFFGYLEINDDYFFNTNLRTFNPEFIYDLHLWVTLNVPLRNLIINDKIISNFFPENYMESFTFEVTKDMTEVRLDYIIYNHYINLKETILNNIARTLNKQERYLIEQCPEFKLEYQYNIVNDQKYIDVKYVSGLIFSYFSISATLESFNYIFEDYLEEERFFTEPLSLYLEVPKSNRPKSELQEVNINNLSVQIFLENNLSRFRFNQPTLYYRVKNGNDWSVVRAVLDDGFADYNPVLEIVDNEVCLIWTKAVISLTSSNNLHDLLQNQEVFFSFFDQNNMEFANIQRLTTNDYLDCYPRFFKNNHNHLTVAWLSHTFLDAIWELPNVNVVIFDNLVAGETYSINCNSKSFSHFDGYIENDSIMLILGSDNDGILSTIEDRLIFISRDQKSPIYYPFLGSSHPTHFSIQDRNYVLFWNDNRLFQIYINDELYFDYSYSELNVFSNYPSEVYFVKESDTNYLILETISETNQKEIQFLLWDQDLQLFLLIKKLSINIDSNEEIKKITLKNGKMTILLKNSRIDNNFERELTINLSSLQILNQVRIQKTWVRSTWQNNQNTFFFEIKNIGINIIESCILSVNGVEYEYNFINSLLPGESQIITIDVISQKLFYLALILVISVNQSPLDQVDQVILKIPQDSPSSLTISFSNNLGWLDLKALLKETSTFKSMEYRVSLSNDFVNLLGEGRFSVSSDDSDPNNIEFLLSFAYSNLHLGDVLFVEIMINDGEFEPITILLTVDSELMIKLSKEINDSEVSHILKNTINELSNLEKEE